MNQITELPDLSRSFKKMLLMDRLDAVDPEKTLIGYSIGFARRKGTPLETIAGNIMEAYNDNVCAILDIVGQDTIDLIRQIYPQ